MYLKAQAHMCLYIKLTAATEISISKTKLNKAHHSLPDLSLLQFHSFQALNNFKQNILICSFVIS